MRMEVCKCICRTRPSPQTIAKSRVALHADEIVLGAEWKR